MNEMIQKLMEERLARHDQEQERVRGVRERFPDVKWPDVYSRPAGYKDGHKIVDVDDRVAIIGNIGEDAFFYNFASSQYKIERHEEALLKMEKVISQVPEYGTPELKPTVFMNGARMVVDVKFPDIKYEVGKHRKDQLNPTVQIRNSYDLSWEFQIRFGAYQQVCSNGMFAHKELQKLSKKHRQNLDVEGTASELVSFMGKFSEQVGWWDRWTRLQLEQEQVTDVMTSIGFTEKRIAEVKALPLMGRGEESLINLKTPSLWDVNSAITQFLTHNIESEMVRIDFGEKIPNILQKFYNQRKAA